MSYKASVIVLLVLYMTAMIGLITPSQQAWYLAYLPYFMLLNAAFLVIHADEKNKSFAIYGGLVFFGSFLLEYIGNKLGWTNYGTLFGWIIDEVPTTIAIFWTIVVYSSCILAGKLPANRSIHVATATVLSVVLFGIVNQVAPKLGFWQINTARPVDSFIIPTVVSLVFSTLFFQLKLGTKNKMAIYVYGGLFIFFVGMIMFLK